MKTRSLLLTLVALALLVCPSFAQVANSPHAESDEQQIRKIEQEWLDAIVKRDAAYLENLEAADFTVTGPSGRTLNKAEDIKEHHDGRHGL